ncbi:PEP-CTERM/exosortase system-associated acyltransferase [Candidatus Kaiserbacteria bacterium]|nr:PEP-CTERM/exosortase system-associated acyltransferase [Candidatus Kaiserbacteria bacterium]
MDSESLYDAYNRYFKVIRADTPELLNEVFRLRYQVYCIEHKFENQDDFPDGRESDAYDKHSIHSLLVHKPSGVIAGSVRLVLPLMNNPDHSLPIDHVCDEAALHDSSLFLREHTGEVSRFAIAKTFRRRIGEQGSPCGVTEESLRAMDIAASLKNDRRIAHHLTLGLISSLVQMSAEYGILVWCSVMERALLRLLTRIGIHFTDLGPQIEYHGKRQPCYSVLDDLLDRVMAERADVWEVLTDKGRFWPPQNLTPTPMRPSLINKSI